MKDFQSESLSHDPIHGYIPFTSPMGLPAGEVAERELIDHPWIQRLRQIHQLQTAWWVFPSAEHTRFQHVLGSMHLASRAVATLYESLHEVCPDVPSRGYVESLMRMAALLHDVGHGPFGHFFDEHYLADYRLNHEILGGEIIRREFAELLGRIRRNPNSRLADDETLDPEQIIFLITRPSSSMADGPRWLRFLRGLFSGLYTVDNMDFVLRDAYMSGYSTRAFDLARLLHYSQFTERGLTIHERGLSALVRFISVRAELFRAIYFHRTVRAIDLELQEVFRASKPHLFPGDPREHLDEYRQLTEWSLLMQVSRWPERGDCPSFRLSENGTVPLDASVSSQPTAEDRELRELGLRWRALSGRHLRWKMACERTVFFAPGEAERASVLSSTAAFESALRAELPPELKQLPLKVDTARHVHRPGAHTPSAGQNFLYDPATGKIRSLDDRELFRRIAISFRICRIYALDHAHEAELSAALDRLTGDTAADEATNM
jgi:HD superfamily phosphohydrolase